MEGLPADLDRLLRGSLLLGIQVEFLQDAIRAGSPSSLVFFESLMVIRSDTQRMSGGLDAMRSSLETAIANLPESNAWGKIGGNLHAIRAELDKLPERTADAVVDRFRAEHISRGLVTVYDLAGDDLDPLVDRLVDAFRTAAGQVAADTARQVSIVLGMDEQVRLSPEAIKELVKRGARSEERRASTLKL